MRGRNKQNRYVFYAKLRRKQIHYLWNFLHFGGLFVGHDRDENDMLSKLHKYKHLIVVLEKYHAEFYK